MDATPLPSSLRIQHARIGDLAEFSIQTVCPCGKPGMGGMPFLIARYGGDVTVRDLVTRLRCQKCGNAELKVYLVEGFHREPCGGPQPGWSLALHYYPPPLLNACSRAGAAEQTFGATPAPPPAR